MSFHVRNSVVTFTWHIGPTGSPVSKSAFDITTVLPIGNARYVDNSITTYVAPTAVSQGIVTFNLTLVELGRYRVTLSTGTPGVHIMAAHREVFSVTPPSAVISGAPAVIIRGPEVIPDCPIPQLDLDISNAFEPNPLKRIYIETENNNPVGIWVSTDGMQAYTARSSQEFIWQYDMVTPFNLGTASLTQSQAYDGPGGSPDFACFTFRNDGLKMWIAQSSNIYAYTMSVAWDISTLTPDMAQYSLEGDAGTGAPGIGNAMFFKPDGTELYVFWSGAGERKIHTWTLGTAWDITTLVYVGRTATSPFETEGSPITAHMTPDGQFWVTDVVADDTFYQYSMSTPYDASTIAYTGLSWDYGAGMPSLTGSSIQGFYISNFNHAIFMTDSSANDYLTQADLV